MLLSIALLLGGCEATLFAGLNATDRRAGVETQRNLVFDATHGLKLDVYRPAGITHAPLVVFFYGGSWVRGERAWYRFVGTALASHGVVTVIPDYRKYPQVKMDGFMQDAARAVAWAHSHAEELGGTPDDIFVMGHSAGGQIGALLVTDPAWLAPYGLRPDELAGFIGLAGCYDFMPIPANEKDMLGMFGRDTSSQARAQPVRFVQGHEPPMLLLQGLADHEVEPSNAMSLAHVLQAHHEEVDLRLYPGVSHNALVFALSRPFHTDAPTLDDVLRFIHAHPLAAVR
ncbi:alpha/beta hydrolase [Dyella nitratireducens]|uniref:Carboxylesterase n=1 Tax=Dyella nitratireducens TaxID=1849580 RepID=A0ABQ1GUD5_9GAMM|nr:alpha/beta hydrolase [Dyella nitratireducens]GGA50299.1 carboxylesterase [Dyella nitratireducens]GLQ42567.1 carboxylesterase [Dyella nitratireducens]